MIPQHVLFNLREFKKKREKNEKYNHTKCLTLF